jgi:intein-encoded DNA endonuclease-like protein
VKQRFHISPLRPKIKELYSRGLSSRAVGCKLGISHARVLQLLDKEYAPRRSITKLIPNPYYKKLTKERAYILGVMCGDGCVFSGDAHKKQWTYKNYIVHLSVKDKDFIDEFIKCVKSVYGITPSLYFRNRNNKNKKWSNIWVAKITRKLIYEDLNSYSFGCKSWCVPKEIVNCKKKDVVGHFLRGFYDSEGSVTQGPRSFTLSICSINKKALVQVKKLINGFGISTSRIYNNRPGLFNIAICGNKNLEIFLKKIGFSIKRKQDKIKKRLGVSR